MIVVDKDRQRFIYRIAGLAIQDGFVLVHQGEGDDHWSLPGGRAEVGESAAQTLTREMQEELGARVGVLRPLWLAENFFAYGARDYHEVGLYFLMTFLEAGPVMRSDGPFFGLDRESRLTFRWVPADAASLSALPLLPSFLQPALTNPPESLQHIVHRG